MSQGPEPPDDESDSTRIRPTPFPPRTPGAPPTPQRTDGPGRPSGPPPGWSPHPPPSWAPGAPPPQPPQWQPPPPNPYGYPGQGGPPSAGPAGPPTTPRPARRRRTPLVVGLVVVVALLVAGAVGLFLTTGSDGVAVGDLRRGDCLASTAVADGRNEVGDVSVVDCDDAHAAQVVAVTTRSGDADVADTCVQALTDVGTSVSALSVRERRVRPLSDGDRVACLVVGDDLDTSVVTTG